MLRAILLQNQWRCPPTLDKEWVAVEEDHHEIVLLPYSVDIFNRMTHIPLLSCTWKDSKIVERHVCMSIRYRNDFQ